MSLRDFGYDAANLVERRCWRSVIPGSPGRGICKAYTVGNGDLIYVCILPTIGYPRNPPFVILIEPEGSRALQRISHPCVTGVSWSALSGLLPKELVGWAMSQAGHSRIVHVLDRGAWEGMRRAANRLILVENLLVNLLGLRSFFESC